MKHKDYAILKACKELILYSVSSRVYLKKRKPLDSKPYARGHTRTTVAKTSVLSTWPWPSSKLSISFNKIFPTSLVDGHGATAMSMTIKMCHGLEHL